ncbi:unnamed protein product [Allacma fusca]|uniref:Uncharacterized protein n=1 Tax=Allacma fusca TaxID=39272 RepID=A0A8J2P497_9HEXA|nr:unnamed protein product [Allacma fusca]
MKLIKCEIPLTRGCRCTEKSLYLKALVTRKGVIISFSSSIRALELSRLFAPTDYTQTSILSSEFPTTQQDKQNGL